jgi:hypothetical protein
MRAIFVVTVVITATVGLMISDGAEQPKRAVKPGLPPPATTGAAEPSPLDMVPGIGAPLIGPPTSPATESLPPAFGLPQPSVTPTNDYPPPIAPPPMSTLLQPSVPVAASGWAYAAQPYAPSSYEIQTLQLQYTKLAAKRAGRMEVQELKQGISEMRRHDLIAELLDLANNADGFDAMRAAVAAAALGTKDRPELEKLSRDLAKELETAKPTKE